jgi:putative membrane protein
VYWLSTLLALWVVDGLFESLHLESTQALLMSALVLALVNLTIKPLLLLVTLPLTVLTLGLAIPLINGLVLLVIAELVPGFWISGFWMGVVCALAISFVSFLIGVATGQSRVSGHMQATSSRTSSARVIDERVIDVDAREKSDRPEN